MADGGFQPIGIVIKSDHKIGLARVEVCQVDEHGRENILWAQDYSWQALWAEDLA